MNYIFSLFLSLIEGCILTIAKKYALNNVHF